LTVKSDTAAYFVLDTVNLNLYTYKASASGRKWRQLGADTAAIAYVNTYGTQTVNGAKTFTSAVTATRFDPTANTATGTGMFAPTSTSLGFSTNGTQSMTLDANGNLVVGATSGNFNVNNQAISVSSAQSGTTSASFDIRGFATSDAGIGQITFFNASNLISLINVARRGANNSGTLDFYTSNAGSIAERMRITSDGNVGIGTGSPAVQLHTTSNVRFAGLASITDLRTDADGDLFNGSDFNLKNSIDTINFGLSDVLKLKPVSFNWNDDGRNINDYKSMGFIAQDVMNVIPNAASTMGDGDMQVDYNAIVATLTKAIQEQQALIKALEQRILTLENK